MRAQGLTTNLKREVACQRSSSRGTTIIDIPVRSGQPSVSARACVLVRFSLRIGVDCITRICVDVCVREEGGNVWLREHANEVK